MKRRVRGLSGGAFDIGFLFGVVDKNVNEEFDAEHGISSGSIIQLVKMCGNWNKARSLVLSFSAKKHVFGYNLLSPRGINKAYKSYVNKDYGLWTFDRLEKTIREVTSEEDYNNYIGCPVWVGISDENGLYHDIRIDKGATREKMTYDKAINYVLQSCSIQLLINSKSGKADGGLNNHIGSEFLAKTYFKCDVVSVFARTKDLVAKQPPISLKSVKWLINDLLHTVSKKNETKTDEICQNNGTEHIKYFMSHDVIDKIFTINDSQREELYRMGLKSKPNK